REVDRVKAVCKFCDTDFVSTDGTGGGKFETAQALAQVIEKTLAGQADRKIVVITGGETLLQLDSEPIAAIKKHNVEIAIETNGTITGPPGIDWICVSPKADARLAQASGQELKLVYPQAENNPEDFEHLPFEHWFLQPMDGPDRERNTQLAINYC